ncbi:MAG: zinc ribbon domain-containing protein [Chloroflexi bacterium]|nr:zinc ribbon domain-containing protein [Chloroflexota bacterium]
MDRCGDCGVALPPEARFCIECGRASRMAAPPVATAATIRIAAPCPRCGVMLDEPGARDHACAIEPRAPEPPRLTIAGDRLMVAGLLVGLAVLAFTRFWWPGIMFVVGAFVVARTAALGRWKATAIAGIWTVGIGVVALTKLWVPGVLLLAAATLLVGAVQGARKPADAQDGRRRTPNGKKARRR